MNEPPQKKAKVSKKLTNIDLDWSNQFCNLKTKSYQDKTDFLRRFLNVDLSEEEQVFPSNVSIYAPSRFLKSSTLDMIHQFCRINVTDQNGRIESHFENTASYQFFQGTKIWESLEAKKHFNKYPVILLNFQGVTVVSIDDYYHSVLTAVICDAYRQHEYLARSIHLSKKQQGKVEKYVNYDGEESDAKREFYSYPLKTLAFLLKKHFDGEFKSKTVKVMVLADEVDCPITSAILKGRSQDFITLVNESMDIMMTTLVKSNPDVNRSLFVSSLYIGGYLSPHNKDLKYIHFRDELFNIANYFTFTEEEVKSLAGKFHPVGNFEDLRLYYGGYDINGAELYNLYSILNYYQCKELKLHWANGGTIEVIRKAFCYRDISNKILDLMKGIEVEATFAPKFDVENVKKLQQFVEPHIKVDKISNSIVDLYLQYLTALGILVADQIPNSTYNHYIRINNQENEIRLLKELYQAEYLQERFGVTAANLGKYANSVKEFLKNPTDTKAANRFYYDAVKLFQVEEKHLPQTEDDVVRVLSSPFIVAEFGTFVHGQLSPPNSRNRSDFIVGLEDHNISLVAETKLGVGRDKTPEYALQQILVKKYKETLKKPLFKSCNKRYVLVGIQFKIVDGKPVLDIKYKVGENDSDEKKLPVLSLPHPEN